ncbi:uncharacterized protein LOC101682684 isoform X1 [Mustela putorius furo]|uniref:Uncharacterized protein LOC101682684 isoform X1 n=1 Tax=Mustela putorius furo TaxID=9669 RepID=A0A8U0RD02_MUSPF|nr:uncharacterized protein LOC101682684 isoform X1 [Mustela putorius furo]
MRLRFPRRLRAARLHPSPSPALGFAPPHAPPYRRGAERAASLPAGPVQSAPRLVRLGRPVWTYGKAVRCWPGVLCLVRVKESNAEGLWPTSAFTLDWLWLCSPGCFWWHYWLCKSSYIWNLSWHYGNEILPLGKIYACGLNCRCQFADGRQTWS